MGRRSKAWGELMLPPLRQYWQEINRVERAEQAELRASRKARDKKRAKCRCDDYKFPHRPGGGLCRYPDPPVVRWQERQAADIDARVTKLRAILGEQGPIQLAELARSHRPYRNRYAGIRRQIARANGLHPIRDRAVIEQLMPHVIVLAKQAKSQYPRAKYRNVEITKNGVRLQWQNAGPMM